MLVSTAKANGGALSWSPITSRASLVAVGSKEGASSGFDNVGGELKIIEYSTTETLATAKTSLQFNTLSWGASEQHTAVAPLGLIAGGMSDGTIAVWSAAKLLAAGVTDAESAPESDVKLFDVAVTAVEFNHHDGKGHLLGCGGADGQVFVVDFSDLGSPNPAAPAPLEQGSHTAAITDVSWNSQVAHILASSDVSGTVNVWDLKNNRRWCQIVGRSPISCIQWNPEQGGILMSAVNDNARPRLQLWHLHQSTTAPLREYAEEHTGGITSMSWCKKDPDLLITCASDNRTLLWDLQQGKSVFEFPTAGAPAPAAAAAGAMPSAAATFGGMPTNSFGGAAGGRNVDVQWSKCIPSIASTCSFDRTLSMYACEAAGEQRPPRWFRRTVGASFSFGGKLSVFGASKQADSAQVVSVNEVRASEPAGMVARCEQFNALVDGAVALAPQKGAEAFVDVCEAKAAASSAEGRAGTGATWKLLRALFHTGQARTEQLLLHVGFNDADVMFRHKADEPAAAADAAEPPSPTIAAAAVAVAATPPPSADELFGASPAVSASDASAGFDMPAPVEDVAKAASPVALAPPPAAALSLAGASASLATTTGPVALDPVLEARLNTCVLVGDFAGAVECSIRAGRVADALLMAASAPDQPELWPIAQKAFFDQQSSRQAIKVVRAVMDDNLSDHVESSELSQWRETLAAIVQYTADAEQMGLCNQLGLRLEKEPEFASAATCCFLVAMNAEKVVEAWQLSALADAAAGVSSHDVLADLIEKVAVFQRLPQKRLVEIAPNHGIIAKFVEYATILAELGRMDLGAKSAQVFPSSESCKALLHRMFRAGGVAAAAGAAQSPYARVAVTAASTARAAAPSAARAASVAPQAANVRTAAAAAASRSNAPVATSMFGGAAAPANMQQQQRAHQQQQQAQQPAQPSYGEQLAAQQAQQQAQQARQQQQRAHQQQQWAQQQMQQQQQQQQQWTQQQQQQQQQQQMRMQGGQQMQQQQQRQQQQQQQQQQQWAQQQQMQQQRQPMQVQQSRAPFVPPTRAAPITPDGFATTAGPGNEAAARQWGNIGGGPIAAAGQPASAYAPSVSAAASGPGMFGPAVAAQQAVAAAPAPVPEPVIEVPPGTYDHIILVFQQSVASLQAAGLKGPQTRQLDACTKAVETLNVRIYTHGAIVPEVLAKLEEMVAAMRGNNLKGAKMVLKSMSRGAYWKTEKTWLKSLKYLFDLLEKMAPK